MKNGDKLRKQLAGQLLEGAGAQSSDSSKASRCGGLPFLSRKRGQDPPVEFADNPLYLASDVVAPEQSTIGDKPVFRGGHPSDVRIDVEASYPLGATMGAAPALNRQRSLGSFSATIEQTHYHSITNSPLPVVSTNEIVEELDMPHDEYKNRAIDVSNLNLIGSPSPRYLEKEVPPIQRVIKEANRVWVVPALTQLPALFDNWWKTRAAKCRMASQGSNKGIGAVLQGLQDKTLSFSPDELFTSQVRLRF